jgi:hypothetical protein
MESLDLRLWDSLVQHREMHVEISQSYTLRDLVASPLTACGDEVLRALSVSKSPPPTTISQKIILAVDDGHLLCHSEERAWF